MESLYKIQTLVNELVIDYETNDPYTIAKEMGIIILYEELGTINGYYNKCYNQKFIHINNNLSKHKQNFVCGHELGHALLHEDENTLFLQTSTYQSVNKLEREANAFASELLIPDNVFDDNPDLTFTEILNLLEIYPTS